MDEAGQIEDAKLFAILARYPMLKKIILVGDPQQLQPYVPQTMRELGYGKSTMERIMEIAKQAQLPSGQMCHVMLDEQHRMPPMISNVISGLYYNGRLRDAQASMHNGPRAGLPWKPLVVIDYQGGQMKWCSASRSFSNENEAEVVRVVVDFVTQNAGGMLDPPQRLSSRDFCILTPFRAHNNLLKRKLAGQTAEQIADEEDDSFNADPDREFQSPFFQATAQASQIPKGNIDTVDRFQGSEKAVVFVSACVDSNLSRAADPHFINVACSRAKHMLFLVGNFSALGKHPDWRCWLEEAQAEGVYINLGDVSNLITVNTMLRQTLLAPQDSRPSRGPGFMPDTRARSPRRQERSGSPLRMINPLR
ncbi:unnamed protein product [Amoebophrya sp. A120]|nr:unnamed protein product [Amoebophrya sp. A120]|eukprot:GSA120T00024971001.1